MLALGRNIFYFTMMYEVYRPGNVNDDRVLVVGRGCVLQLTAANVQMAAGCRGRHRCQYFMSLLRPETASVLRAEFLMESDLKPKVKRPKSSYISYIEV